MNIRYKTVLAEIDAFMDSMVAQMARPIKDLEDVRLAMLALESVRYRQLDIDSTLGPIEVGCVSSLNSWASTLTENHRKVSWYVCVFFRSPAIRSAMRIV